MRLGVLNKSVHGIKVSFCPVFLDQVLFFLSWLLRLWGLCHMLMRLVSPLQVALLTAHSYVVVRERVRKEESNVEESTAALRLFSLAAILCPINCHGHFAATTNAHPGLQIRLAARR
jgi:hypothetical protein